MKSLKLINLENARKRARNVATATEQDTLTNAIALLNESIDDLIDRADATTDQATKEAYDPAIRSLAAARQALIDQRAK